MNANEGPMLFSPLIKLQGFLSELEAKSKYIYFIVNQSITSGLEENRVSQSTLSSKVFNRRNKPFYPHVVTKCSFMTVLELSGEIECFHLCPEGRKSCYLSTSLP